MTNFFQIAISSIFIIFFLFSPLNSFVMNGQTIVYSYDSSGNRIKRTIAVEEIKAPAHHDTQDQSALLSDRTKNVTIDADQKTASIRIDITNFEDSARGQIRLYDSSGRVMTDMSVSAAHHYMDVSAYPEGVYILYVFYSGEEYSWKIIL